MSGGGAGVGRGDHGRRDEDQGERVDGSEPLLRGLVREILREAEGTDRGRTSSTAMRGVMSCPSAADRGGPQGGAGGRQAAIDGAQGPRGRREEPEPGAGVDRVGARSGWPRAGGASGRVARRELEARREREAAADPARSRGSSVPGAGRLEENHRVDLAANQAYEGARRRATPRDGR